MIAEPMPLRGPAHPVWLAGALAAVGIVVTLLWHSVLGLNVGLISELPNHYPIPPTFGGSRIFYGVVLALMMIADVLAFGATIDNFRFLLTNHGGMREPAKVAVVNETILLVAILFSTVPDVLVLLSWGELMAPPYALLSKLDRALDGVSALTFVCYVSRRIRSRPTMLFTLQRQPIPVEIVPTWEQLRPKVAVVIAVAVISFGVAFAK